ncbi:NUDIX hydrolase [Allonocardiopsis opalescens]|uniref:ADP-ribose pyrophosphatase n=1 Tax=Allonocardiopsis opalescens TaxID=1144618 RepID=A0A2T0QDJ3_9ACTN|nr:NUDIX hydrolase [Allonocardiopsis opalescens]PRY01913.1 ADP-ribose pyrophosphatase [Allonocardiopsis opalescens]
MLVRDAHGSALLALHPPDAAPGGIPVPAALVVARLGGSVLLVFDRWRARWELPGGGIDPGETPRQAAGRELFEESGQRADRLDPAVLAEFELPGGDGTVRRELAAVYRCALAALEPGGVPNDEIAETMLWDPARPPPADASPIDTAIAAAVLAAWPGPPGRRGAPCPPSGLS